MKTNYHLFLLTSTLFTLSTTLLSATEEDNSTKRFSIITFERQIILQDSHTKLEWVNGRDKNSSVEDGYKNFPKSKSNIAVTIKNESKRYCKELTFATYNDWRVPTPQEHQALIQATEKENFPLYYSNLETPRVIAISDNKLTTIDTNNSQPVAKIIPWENQQEAGLRCVRDAEDPLAP
jgi:hypothetical protein